MEHKIVSLTTINNGAALELFEEELKKVLANMNDVSVESDATREITLKFKFKPSNDGSMAVTTVQAISKMAPIKPHGGSIFVTGRNAYVNNPNQINFDFEGKESTNGK